MDFPSYENKLSQKKIGDSETNINYICPKYWDISKNVSIHPRDIYDQLNNIIPMKFKGVTKSNIIANEGGYFKNVSELNIKKIVIEYFKYLDILNLLKNELSQSTLKTYEEKLKKKLSIITPEKKETIEEYLKFIQGKGKKIDKELVNKYESEIKKILLDSDKKYLELEQKDFKSFNDIIKKLLPEDLYNNFHQSIVRYIQPQFFREPIVENNYGIPCCFTYKESYKPNTHKKAVLNNKDINISELSQAKYNKFAHIHPKLQNLFGHNIDFYTNKRYEGGFIIYGIDTQTDTLMNTLSNLHYKKNDKKMNYMDSFIMPKLQDEQSLKLYLKLSCGNILHLFKSEKCSENDIKSFINFLYIYDTIKKPGESDEDFTKREKLNRKIIINQLKNINYYGQYKQIKKDLNQYKNDLISNKCDDIIEEFLDIIYKKDIKFLYDLIISRKNYINYLKSQDIKDYKYILPLVSEINENKVYILFENEDDQIKLKLDYDDFNLYENGKQKEGLIFNFIYKLGDKYQPIYYLNDEKKMQGNNLECDIKNNMHDDKKISEYINNILKSLIRYINIILSEKYKDIDLKPLKETINMYELSNIKLLVDTYSKVSHIIKNNVEIFPVLPSKIIDGYELIYSFSELKNYPTFNEFLKYKNQYKGDESSRVKNKNLRKSLDISGFVLNGKGNIINIVFKNNSYIPIKEEPYDKKNKYMKSVKILGTKDLTLLNNDIINFKKGSDECSVFNNNIDYINYITNLCIQNIIYYIKDLKNNISEEYYTNAPELFKVARDEGDGPKPVYSLKKISKKINGEIINIIKKCDEFYVDDEKFTGIITDKGNPNPLNKLSKIVVEKSLLDEIYLILNDPIKINYDKQNIIYEKINEFINDIVIELSDKDYEKYKEENDISICFAIGEGEKCIYPCFRDKGKSKLYVKKSDIYQKDKLLINKIIYKFIDLLLIHKNVDRISDILQDNININNLYKTAKKNEIFFNYIQFKNKYINDMFKLESSYIRNINFYDQSNNTMNSSTSSKPIKSILKGVPNIINKLFKYNSVLTYLENDDFISLEKGLSEILNEEIDTIKIKSDINYVLKNYLKEFKNMKFIVNSYMLYDKKFNITDLNELKQNIEKENYKINPFDLALLSKKYVDIGFLLISSKYSEIPGKLSENIILKYNNEKVNKSTKFILLYDHLEDEEYNLSNIIINNIGDDESVSNMSLEELYKISEIKNIIDKKYSELIVKLN